MNWTGLLKWSLSHQDSTKETDIPALTEEQKAWLKEAMEELVVDEVKQMKKILGEIEQRLRNPEIDKKEREAECVVLVEELQDLLSVSDSAINLCKVGGIISMFDIAYDQNLSSELRSAACRLIAESCQNNPFVQDFATKFDFCKLCNVYSDSNSTIELKAASLSALSAIIKGNNLVTKRIILAENGLPFLMNIVRNSEDKGQTARALSMMNDLMIHKRHLAYDILLLHSLDENLPLKNELLIFQKKVTEEEPELLTLLIEKLKLILTDHNYKGQFGRIAFVDCLKAIRENQKREGRADESLWIKIRKQLEEEIHELQKSAHKDDFFETELYNLDNFLQNF